ncbi:uncharacterized protein [Physcomitrium patens]|uniref:uncharacterized protein n=1 Tax=Physcomitrium patens TaxID=3218 RepID=UPI003CCCBF0E
MGPCDPCDPSICDGAQRRAKENGTTSNGRRCVDVVKTTFEGHWWQKDAVQQQGLGHSAVTRMNNNKLTKNIRRRSSTSLVMRKGVEGGIGILCGRGGPRDS